MNTGGAETFLMKIYRQIDKTKYQMDFGVNMQQKGFYDDEIIALGGKIYYIPPKSSNIKEYKNQLDTVIRKEKYEVVLVYLILSWLLKLQGFIYFYSIFKTKILKR